ncbi:MAG TPA: hypothetical protein DEA05_04185 [Rhodobacteraceae bacterium]|jgi:hypothetical protein|nr:hypothetical protein [Paracoccaceae bacterium]
MTAATDPRLPVTVALVLPDLHAHGYDLGRVLSGANSLIMGALVWRSGLFAKPFGAGLGTAGGIAPETPGRKLEGQTRGQ